MRHLHTQRSAIAAIALAGIVGLGACSAELEDETDAATTDSSTSGTDSSEAEAPADDEPTDDSSETDEPVETSAPSPDSDAPVDEDQSGDTGQPGDTDEPSGTTDDPKEPESPSFEFVEGLTIVAVPDNGHVSSEGAYDCGGRSVTVDHNIADVVLTGECPDVDVAGSQVNVLIDSTVPTDLVTTGDSNEVLMNIAGSVATQGNENKVGFARSGNVTVDGTKNQLVFRKADSVAANQSSEQNEVAFIEADAIDVNGRANKIGYGAGPTPTDNGAETEIVSGDQVGDEVTDLLAELETTFAEMTGQLPS